MTEPNYDRDEECEPYRPEQEDERERPDTRCQFPGACLMPGDHLSSECHTAEMLEDYLKEIADEFRPIPEE